MAMLAEPRQKKRYNLTPRGKALYEDDSRFGTKMLEKMGWSKGKGLGANEDGSQDFVRVRMRNTNEGLGYEDRDDHWTQHEQDFSGLLKTLNGETDGDTPDKNNESASDDEAPRIGFGFAAEPKKPKVVKLKDKISGISLEEKSKMSKVRVHYRKFTKGKDIAQYSEKDLANIFGKKVVETGQPNGVYAELTAMTCNELKKDEVIKPVYEEEKEIKSNFSGVQTISTGLSVNDYFKQKMEAMKNKQKQYKDESFEKVDEQIAEDVENVETKKKSKKRKRQEVREIESNDADKTEGDIVLVVQRKKEKRKKKASNTEASENVFESKKEKKKGNQIALETVDLTQEAEEPKKKRKLKKEGYGERCDSIDVIPTGQMEENSVTEQPKKAKKSKKAEKEQVAEEIPAATTENEVLTPQMLKTKKKKDKKLSTTDEYTSLPNITGDVCVNDVANKKKKKSKNKEKLENIPKIELGPPQEKECPLESLQQNSVTTTATSTNSKDVSEDINIQSMTLDELREKYNSYNVYTISSFCAEKFRNVDLECFRGATLSHLPGYSYTGTNLQLNVQFFPNDEQRITELWNCTINKYQHTNPKAIFHKYRRNMVKAYHAKKKHLPRLHMKSFKRKSIFQPI